MLEPFLSFQTLLPIVPSLKAPDQDHYQHSCKQLKAPLLCVQFQGQLPALLSQTLDTPDWG